MLHKIPKTAAEILANATYDPNAKPPKVVKHRKPVSHADALVNFPAKTVHKKTTERSPTSSESSNCNLGGAPLGQIPNPGFQFLPVETPDSYSANQTGDIRGGERDKEAEKDLNINASSSEIPLLPLEDANVTQDCRSNTSTSKSTTDPAEPSAQVPEPFELLDVFKCMEGAIHIFADRNTEGADLRWKREGIVECARRATTRLRGIHVIIV